MSKDAEISRESALQSLLCFKRVAESQLCQLEYALEATPAIPETVEARNTLLKKLHAASQTLLTIGERLGEI
jgi:hypothetical protein